MEETLALCKLLNDTNVRLETQQLTSRRRRTMVSEVIKEKK